MLSQSLNDIVGQDYLAVFPSGWEARPWDNIYTLKSVDNEGGRARLDLSEGWEIVVPEDCRYFFVQSNLFVILSDAILYYPGGQKKFDKGVFCLIKPDLRKQQKVFEIYRSINEELLL